MTASSVLYLHLVGLFCLSVVGLPHNNGRRHSGHRGLEHGTIQSREPYFETQADPETGHPTRNITTVEGGKATLICTVRNLGDNNTVSWIRKAKHPVVLTSGPAVFTSDRRFKLSHPGGDQDSWQLEIQPTMGKDHGLYECQVNTGIKMSQVFKLNVEPAKARIFGESAVYVKAGSTISLTCAINLYSVPPPDITWLHGSKVLNFDSPRGGISLEIEKTRTGTTSKLLVTRAMPSDSGSYTCNPTRGQPTSADVHVITDENPAELQDGQTSLGTRNPTVTLSSLLLVLLICRLLS